MFFSKRRKAFRINFVWKRILHSSCYIQFILLSSSSLNNFIMNIFFISSCCLHYKVFSSNCLKFIYIFFFFSCFFDQFRSYLLLFFFKFQSRMCVLLNCFVYTIQYQITHLNDYYLTIKRGKDMEVNHFFLLLYISIIILQILYKYMYYNICSE